MGVKTAQVNQEYQQVVGNRDLYSDFNHIFLPHPNTGQISRKTNVDAVKMAVRNLVLTNKYERLRNPEFGGNLSRYLFENFTPLLLREMREHVKWMIETYEPRVRLEDVQVEGSDDRLEIDIKIIFSIFTSPDLQTVDITLYRVR